MVGVERLADLRSHILPHLVGPLIVFSTLSVAALHPCRGRSLVPRPRDQAADRELGNVARRRENFYTTRPQLMLWPAIAMVLTTLAFNLLGDGLRDAFDPAAPVKPGSRRVSLSLWPRSRTH